MQNNVVFLTYLRDDHFRRTVAINNNVWFYRFIVLPSCSRPGFILDHQKLFVLQLLKTQLHSITSQHYTGININAKNRKS